MPSTVTNGLIAFQRGEHRIQGEIPVMQPDGTDQKNLTNNSAYDRHPAWSPDGTRIAFQSDRGGNLDIYVINPDGTNETRLTTDPGGDGSADWSPDGTRIVFYRIPAGGFDGQLSELWIMDADGGNPARITFNPATGVGSQVSFPFPLRTFPRDGGGG